MNWQDVAAAAGIATAVATGFSAMTGWWWRRLDRQEPDWVATQGRIDGEILSFKRGARSAEGDEPEHREEWYRRNLIDGQCKVTNVGDGRAFRVRVGGVGCRVRIEGVSEAVSTGGVTRKYRSIRDFEAILEPGDSFIVALVSVPWQSVESARVALSWTGSPTWRGWRSRRVQFVRLIDWMPVDWSDGPPPKLGRSVDAEGTITDVFLEASKEEESDIDTPRSWLLLRRSLRRST